MEKAYKKYFKEGEYVAYPKTFEKKEKEKHSLDDPLPGWLSDEEKGEEITEPFIDVRNRKKESIKLPAIGDKAVYTQNGETVTIVKIRDVEVDRDQKGRKLAKPYTSYTLTVEFEDGERQKLI